MVRHPPVDLDVSVMKPLDMFPRMNTIVVAAYMRGEPIHSALALTEDERMNVNKAGIVVATLQVMEAVAEKAVEKHKAGEPFTFGELGAIVAGEVEDAIIGVGLGDTHWRPAPAKRQPRQPKAGGTS